MRLRVGVLMLCLGVAGTAVAQNSSARSGKSGRPSCVNERLANSASERLRWEAAQTWISPAFPKGEDASEHSIHIDQPPLTLPKLRREWLQPSQEATLQKDGSDLVPDIEGRSSSFLPRPAK
jgi:hypothetical protein